jgi:hypothetical protein
MNVIKACLYYWILTIWQKKSGACNELLNKFKQVEPNAMRDTVVPKINYALAQHFPNS